MNKLIFVLGIVSLTGCSQFNKILGLSSSGTTPMSVVVDGQSNGANLTESELASSGLYIQSYVNIAIPSTRLSEHIQGGAYYANTINTIAQTKPQLYIWWQGEQDSLPWLPEDVNYAQEFISFIRQLQAVGGNFTVVIVKLSSKFLYANSIQGQFVRQAQYSLNFGNIKVVNIDDLDPADGHVHYSHEQREIIAKRIKAVLES